MKYCPYCMSELTEQDAQCPVCHRAPQDYQSPPHALRQGAMLNNRYLVGGIIGEGGFGITYIGLDTLLQFRVAIKEFFPNGMVNRNNTVSNEVLSISTESAKELFSKSRENFLREARTLAKFTDEAGVVAVRDFFEENRTVYIVMEYLDGITLKSYLKQVGNISPYNTVCLLMPVFRSLRKIRTNAAFPSCSSTATPRWSSTAATAYRARGRMCTRSARSCTAASRAACRPTRPKGCLRTS